MDYIDDLLASLYPQGGRFLKQSPPPPIIPFWVVPDETQLRGKDLCFRFISGKRDLRPDHRTMRNALRDFLNLVDARDQALLEYARTWGKLGLCEKHGLPMGHQTKTSNVASDHYISESGCESKSRGDWVCEPLQRWRHYSRHMRSVVSLAVALHKAKPASEDDQIAYGAETRQCEFVLKKGPSEQVTVNVSDQVPGRGEDWRIVLEDFAATSISGLDPVLVGRSVLSKVINRWLDITGVRPVFWWGDEYGFVLQGSTSPSLLPRLAVQLMLEVSRSPDYALCQGPGCTRVFLLRKGQNSSRRTYCAECGKKVAQAEAIKRYQNAERRNPDRKKRKRINCNEREAIVCALKEQPRPIGLIEKLAKRNGVSKAAIHKIGQRAKGKGALE